MRKPSQVNGKHRPGRSVGARSTRSDLLEAASALLRERSGEEPSVSEIAARANANSALIGYHFGSKDGLLLALVERDMSMGLRQLEKLIDSPFSAFEKLRIHIAGLINLYFKYPYIHSLLLKVVERSPPSEAQKISERLVAPIAHAHRKLLEEGVKRGEFRPTNPMFFYYSVLGACDRLFSSTYSLRTVFGVDEVSEEMKGQFIDHTTALLLYGVLEGDPPLQHARLG